MSQNVSANLLQDRGQYHPDRLSGLMKLAAVYNALGKFKKCSSIVNEALTEFDRIASSEHSIAKNLTEYRKR
jgi:hypothetical protein